MDTTLEEENLAARPAPAVAGQGIDLRTLKVVARKGGTSSQDDPYWLSRYFYRHVTIYFTYACVKLGINANLATLLSAVALFAGSVCYVMPSRWAWLAGALLVQAYFILDHVDGELARYETIHLGKIGGVSSGVFYDTCCHAGELALLAGIGLRLFADTGGAWWVAVVLLLAYFPGNIMPWQRYCEAVVAYARKHVEGDRAALPAELVGSSSLAWAPAAGRLTRGRIISVITQTVGFPGYFVTLLICTTLDVVAVPAPISAGRTPYLFLWLVVRAVHSSAAALKSMRVYARRLATLR